MDKHFKNETPQEFDERPLNITTQTDILSTVKNKNPAIVWSFDFQN